MNTQNLLNYLKNHGFNVISAPEIARPTRPGLSRVRDQSFLEHVIDDQAMNDSIDPRDAFVQLVDFIKQMPKIQSIQLKPLLFAFFYYTVCKLKENQIDKANDFFNTYVKSPDTAFHSIHQTDIKKLEQNLKASKLASTQKLAEIVFQANLTETTFQALVAFLNDKQFMFFMKILKNYLKVIFVPLNYFTNRGDEPNFIYHSTNQSDGQSKPFIQLLETHPFDLAKQYMGDDLEFDILDDDPSIRASNPYPLPKVLIDRVICTASDLCERDKLDKNNLPSCAYFTFSDENLAYDINYNGTLIAFSTKYGYSRIIPTQRNTFVEQIRQHQIGPSSYSRKICGPRTYSMRFSPDSRLLLCGGSSVIRIWECEQDSAFCQIQTRGGIIWCTDWSPFGYHFAIGSDEKMVQLFGIDRSFPLRIFFGHQEPITAIKFHPNATTIATTSYDRSVMLWDVRADSGCYNIRVFAESNDVPMSLEFSRNGKYVISGDERGKITSWDIGEGRKIGSVKWHKGEIRDMSISLEGNILSSAGSNGEVALWDMATLCGSSANGAEPLKKLMPSNSYTHRLSFSSRNLLHAIGSRKMPPHFR